MKKNIFILTIISFCLVFSTYAQDIPKKTKQEYETLSYVKSTKKLLNLVDQGIKTQEVLQKLGNAYYFNSKMEDASKWYGELLSTYEDVDSEYFYRYAMTLKAMGEYTKANEWMEYFAQSKPDDKRAILYSQSPNYLSTIDKISTQFEIENLSTNTKYSDFGTSFYKDGIVFASSRGTGGKLYSWNEQPFLDLYYKEFNSDKVVPLDEDVNTKFHESSTSFTNDGTTMYFTRNNYYRGKERKSNERVNGLKIYKATLENGSWGNIVPMPFNNDDYNVAHPALSADNKKLYFASDMPGTLGKSDLFVVDINDDGSYGEPRNLGPSINTEGRENFPYISNNGTLYFSSDGRLGLGGLDVFFVDLESSNLEVNNIGKPINGPKDDFEYIIDENTLTGYFTSNRSGGKGDDDIYKFGQIPCDQFVSGTVVDKNTNEIIPNANVIVYDSDRVEVQNMTSDENGAFSYESNCKKENYLVIATKGGYFPDEILFENNTNDDVVLKLNLEPKVVAPVETDLAVYLDLDPIYFDFDKSNIRADARIEIQKVIDYMNAYPTVKVDVRSHTDSRAPDLYNDALSERRNKSTIQYLINSGISASRLTGRGYGENVLVNECSNGVKCTEAQHQDNRRSEFIVISN
ncbi:OmpA family protein [Lacinutrix salivirga]